MTGIITAVFVPGIGRTKGSLNFHGQGRVSEGVALSKEWRKAVRDAVFADRQRRGLTVPSKGDVAVQITLWVERSNDGPTIGRGDLDKLQRNVGDALADDQFNEGTRRPIAGTRAIQNDNQITLWNDPVKIVAESGFGMLLVAWDRSPEEVRTMVAQRADLLAAWRSSGWGVTR